MQSNLKSFIEVDNNLGGVAAQEHDDDGGEERRHSVVPPGNQFGKQEMIWIRNNFLYREIFREFVDLKEFVETLS